MSSKIGSTAVWKGFELDSFVVFLFFIARPESLQRNGNFVIWLLKKGMGGMRQSVVFFFFEGWGWNESGLNVTEILSFIVTQPLYNCCVYCCGRREWMWGGEGVCVGDGRGWEKGMFAVLPVSVCVRTRERWIDEFPCCTDWHCWYGFVPTKTSST